MTKWWSAPERARRRDERRQRRFDEQFRIPERGHPEDLLAAVRQWAGEDRTSELPAPPVDGFDDDLVAAMATDVWRTARRVDQDTGPDAPRTQRQIARGVGAVRRRLADAGVEIEEHDGLAFVEGLALDVVAWEPRDGVERDVVVETVQPSVYRAGRCIQMGQVIVAQPARGASA